MKTFVTAIIVSHNSPDFLDRTIAATKSQNVDQLIIVETGAAENPNAITAPGAKLGAAISLAERNAAPQSEWLWVLHDDSAPLSNSLKELLHVVELSPSVALVGPKLVGWEDSKLITQQGLTLTRRGALFSLVSDELDQSQHDAMDDVLAVGTAGMLVKRSVWQSLGGLVDEMPPLAADLDFSMRVRLAGHRVVVAPQARVAHAALSLRGKRDRSWLRVQPKSALRRAELQLRLSYAPLAQALLFWFFLPLLTLGRLIWRVWTKRPDRLIGDVGAAIWAYCTIGARLRHRRRVSNRRALTALYATKQQVRDEKRQNAEQEEIDARLEAHAALAERDQSSPNTEQLLLGVGHTSKSFIAAGGFWFVLLLTAVSIAWLPRGDAITGGGSLPLSSNWLELFRRAGASWQPIGHGFVAPADPFVWVLTALGGVTFWSPSLAITLLVFFAKAIAFFGAFKAVSLFTKKTWLRNLGALTYALWPSLTEAQTELRIPSIVAQLVLPLLIFTVAKVALFGVELSVRSRQQIWTWVGLSGLLMAFEVASAPNTSPVILLAMIFVCVARLKRIGYLIWIAVPTAAIFGPLFIYALFTNPLMVFADPGVALATNRGAGWQLLLGATTAPLGIWELSLTSAVLLALALLALLTTRRAIALLSLGLGLLALLTARVALAVSFVTAGGASVSGSPQALLAIWGLAAICSAAVALESIRRRAALRVAAAALIALFVLPSAALTAVVEPQAKWGSARVMPALIEAQAAAGSATNVLVITKSGAGYAASWIPASGTQLEDQSVAYRFALSELQKTSPEYSEIGQLVADLISGGTDSSVSALAKHQIGYVLVPNSQTEVASSLDSVAALEGAGETDYGKIWRVRSANILDKATVQSPWSITKGAQIAVLISFILLAIPTSGRKRAAGTAEIFVDAGDGTD